MNNEAKKYAGFWIRAGAFILDMLLIAIVYYVVTYTLYLSKGGSGGLQDFIFTPDPDIKNVYLGSIIWYVMPFIYATILISSAWQATVGKKLLKVKVMTKSGNKLNIFHSALRYLVKWLPINLVTIYMFYIDVESFDYSTTGDIDESIKMIQGMMKFTYIGYVVQLLWFLTIVITKEKKALHDIICNTRVVYAAAELLQEEPQSNKSKWVYVGKAVATVLVISLIYIGYEASRFFSGMSDMIEESSIRLELKKMPSILSEPRIYRGGHLLTKTIFSENLKVGNIQDIKQTNGSKSKYVITGDSGAAFIDNEGKIVSSFMSRYFIQGAEAYDIDGDGDYEFIANGFFNMPASLFDHNGKKIWSFDYTSEAQKQEEFLKKHAKDDPDSPLNNNFSKLLMKTVGGKGGSINSVSAGDLDGDGIMEIVFTSGNGVYLYSDTGKELWFKKAGNAWNAEIVDFDNDGNNEIINSSSGGDLTIRDVKGNELKEIDGGGYIGEFSLARIPNNRESFAIVSARDNVAQLLDFSGKILQKYASPYSDSGIHFYGTPFSTNTGVDYFATVTEFFLWKKTIFNIYDDNGGLVYHETLPDSCQGMQIVLNDSSKEELLLGCKNKIWKYSFNDSPKENIAANDNLNSPFLAISTGEADKLVTFLETENPDVNATDSAGYTLLETALMYNDFQAVNTLLDKGVDPDFTNASGEPLIHQAIGGTDTELLKVLLAHGANVEKKNKYKYTPLRVASKSGNAEAVKLLLENGANPNNSSSKGSSLLYTATYNKRNDVAKLLASHKADINHKYCAKKKEQMCWTPLSIAIHNNDIDLAKFLINQIDKFKEGEGAEAVHGAIYNGDLELIELLLQKGAEANEDGEWNGFTVEQMIRQHGGEEMQKLFDKYAH